VAAESRRAVVALAVCIVVLLGAGVTGALTVEEEASGQSRPSVAASAKSPSAEPAPAPAPIDLGAVVVPGPAGFDQIPDAKLLVGGAVTGARLAAERADQTRAQALFTETRLVSGFVRAWQRPSTSELVTVRLYEFAGPDGAKAYATKVIAAMTGAPASTFNVPATDDTVGIDSHARQGPNRLMYVIQRKGRLVAAFAAALAAPPEAGPLGPLARSQQSLLP